jgi:membrane protein YqaA with SNARE-associated domain
MASLGSALGSIPLYILGYLGGEKVLRKRISEERFLKIHRSFERHEFWALMFPGMLPPPTPFKIFVLGAAVFEMRFRDFLVAIFLGRFVRFLVLSVLVLWFGPQIVGLFGGVFRRHWISVVAAIVLGICLWVGVRLWRRVDEDDRVG